ncbi:MAG: tRNA (N6-isopentenyl adenosine(37)-C2)-methylthiotransferase MiaB [Verrucomicrobiae bacterium]|nr:tRNA (N6-isopentenyl adenosine(37)-C2)-methylthiotransferase MiaB [Verrucomicrobiae bacterium]
MAKVFIKTYGCQMNERDSEQVGASLVARGHVLTPEENEADVILYNTCSVRDMAEQKALARMGNVVHRKRESGRGERIVLGFLGCMAQSRGEDLFKTMPELDLVVGTQKFHRVADHIEALLKARELKRICDTEEELDSQNTIRDHLSVQKAAPCAFVSIMQGCNMNCTYCIVPFTRGGERGRPIPEIVAEVGGLAARGVRDVTLLGQIVNLYGRHEFPERDGKSPFVQLLEAVHGVEGIDRIRFTSPHPIGFREDLIGCYGRLAKLCEHVHLPVQSGSNRILKAMHRAYTRERYLTLIANIRERVPDVAVTGDIIVGFPGETEEDFEETRSLAREVDFDNVYVFRYSPRKDTPASEMAEQVEESVKERRNQVLLADLKEIALRKSRGLVGQEVEILVDGPSKTNPDRLSGRTRKNQLVVFDGGSPRHIGQIMRVRINETTGYTLYGQADILND